ncbi:MAG TPA: hypothetical protein VMB81_02520 [Candidatus Sulfotelmatobacter sp.]|nr:hypothetical protein [Candidatus Sulfotelmatobacter sp.]
MTRARLAWLAGAAVVLAIATAPASHAGAATNCRLGSDLVAPGRAMCLDGFTTVCQPTGAWAVDRHAPCFAGGVTRAACQISAYETAAPGARTCSAGRPRQCSEHGEWIDLAGGC